MRRRVVVVGSGGKEASLTDGSGRLHGGSRRCDGRCGSVSSSWAEGRLLALFTQLAIVDLPLLYIRDTSVLSRSCDTDQHDGTRRRVATRRALRVLR